MKFTDLGLSEPILRAIAAESYLSPTPIQAQAIPHVLAGRDVLGCAQTGTGKTAAFALPIVQRLAAGQGNGKGVRPIRALILSPTRELALQIAENLSIYARHTHLRHAAIFGGVGQAPQVRALNNGVDIVIATPGRLEDLMQQGYVGLRSVEVFVLDEADRMLDMGFIQPIRRIAAALPASPPRQTLLFSATMPREILHLAHALLRDPVSVEAAPAATTPVIIEQSVYLTHRDQKPALLAHLLRTGGMKRTLVFTRTKHGADKVVKRLGHAGIAAEAIHGNKRQNVRQRALDNFRTGRIPVLIATDIAARGIDVDDVSHVINYELPHEPETYVHRIGRTGRAGNSGIAIAFCDHDERDSLKAIERLVRKPLRIQETPRIERLPEPIRLDQHRDQRGAASRGRDDQRKRNPSPLGRGQRLTRPDAASPSPRGDRGHAERPLPLRAADAAPSRATGHSGHLRPGQPRPLTGRPAPRVPGNFVLPSTSTVRTQPRPATPPVRTPHRKGPSPTQAR